MLRIHPDAWRCEALAKMSRLISNLRSHPQVVICRMMAALQDEVARRLLAGPDSGLEYRAMNLEVAFYSHPTYLFEVDRTAYVPEPNVDGAVVKFALRAQQQWPLQSDLDFLKLVSGKHRQLSTPLVSEEYEYGFLHLEAAVLQPASVVALHCAGAAGIHGAEEDAAQHAAEQMVSSGPGGCVCRGWRAAECAPAAAALGGLCRSVAAPAS